MYKTVRVRHSGGQVEEGKLVSLIRNEEGAITFIQIERKDGINFEWEETEIKYCRILGFTEGNGRMADDLMQNNFIHP